MNAQQLQEIEELALAAIRMSSPANRSVSYVHARNVALLLGELKRLTTWHVWPDEKPQYDGQYLCAVRLGKGKPPVMRSKLAYCDGAWFNGAVKISDWEISHWISLPELPEEARL